MTDDAFAEGCYAYDDLEAKGIVRGRTDLARKQKHHGFPRPIKTGTRQATFLRSEVHDWLRERAALRDTPVQIDAPKPAELRRPRHAPERKTKRKEKRDVAAA